VLLEQALHLVASHTPARTYRQAGLRSVMHGFYFRVEAEVRKQATNGASRTRTGDLLGAMKQLWSRLRSLKDAALQDFLGGHSCACSLRICRDTGRLRWIQALLRWSA
jgi:hypothetical protein